MASPASSADISKAVAIFATTLVKPAKSLAAIPSCPPLAAICASPAADNGISRDMIFRVSPNF